LRAGQLQRYAAGRLSSVSPSAAVGPHTQHLVLCALDVVS
jgi:hypothetical protein